MNPLLKCRKIGETTWLPRTEDVVTYTEFCKQPQPSISAKEIQRKHVDNNVCVKENSPFTSSVTQALREDLGYSYNQLNVTVRRVVNCKYRTAPFGIFNHM